MIYFFITKGFLTGKKVNAHNYGLWGKGLLLHRETFAQSVTFEQGLAKFYQQSI